MLSMRVVMWKDKDKEGITEKLLLWALSKLPPPPHPQSMHEIRTSFNFKKVSKLIWTMPKKRVFSLLGFRPLELCRNGRWVNYFSPSIFLPPHPIHHLREGSTRCPPLPTSETLSFQKCGTNLLYSNT